MPLFIFNIFLFLSNNPILIVCRHWLLYLLKDNEPEGRFIQTIHNSDSMCTHILWDKDEKTNTERLYLACENGSMITIRGRENFIPKEDAKQKQLKNDQESSDFLNDNIDLGSELGLETQSQGLSAPNKRLQKRSSNEDEDDEDDKILDEATEDLPKGNPFVADEAEDAAENLRGDGDSVFDDVLASQKDTDVNVETIQTNSRDYDNGDNGDGFEVDDEEDNYEDFQANQPVSAVKPQPSFAPSSTPFASKTILCWNHIGVITSREDDDRRSILINFTDAMANRPVTFTDNMQFVLGSLGEEGAIFATDLLDNVDDEVDDNIRAELDGLNHLMSDATKAVVKQSERKRGGRKGDRSTGSCIYFNRFNTFGQIKNKDWVVTLPEGEKVLGCATGEGWNAVVTR